MGLFGGDGGPKPGEAANQYLSQIPGMEKGYYDPFIQHGEQAYGTMNPQLQQMTQDPSSFINALMSKYSESPGAKLQRQEAMRAAGNTAAAGGMRGSVQNIAQQAQISDRLMGSDMQNWLQNVLGVQRTGLSGEQHMYDMGYDASKGLAGDLSNVLGQQGQYAFQQARQDQSDASQGHSGIGSILGGVGGALVGGPAGAMIGSSLGGAVGGMM